MNLIDILRKNKLLCRQKAVCEDNLTTTENDLSAARESLAECEAEEHPCNSCCDECCFYMTTSPDFFPTHEYFIEVLIEGVWTIAFTGEPGEGNFNNQVCGGEFFSAETALTDIRIRIGGTTPVMINNFLFDSALSAIEDPDNLGSYYVTFATLVAQGAITGDTACTKILALDVLSDDTCCLKINQSAAFSEVSNSQLFIETSSDGGTTWDGIIDVFADLGFGYVTACLDNPAIANLATSGYSTSAIRIRVVQADPDLMATLYINNNPVTGYTADGDDYIATLAELGLGLCGAELAVDSTQSRPLSSVYYAACIGSTTVDTMTTYDVDDNILQTFPINIETLGTVRIVLNSTELIKKVIFNTTIGSSTDTQINVCIASDTIPCINGGQFTGNPIGDLTITGLNFPADAIILFYITCDGCACA